MCREILPGLFEIEESDSVDEVKVDMLVYKMLKRYAKKTDRPYIPPQKPSEELNPS